MNRLFDTRGFTIIELVLVLLITGILGGLGLSAYKGAERSELMITANHIQSLVRSAQAQAYGEQSTHMIMFEPTYNECIHLHNSKTINTVTIPNKITMRKTNFPDNKLYFRGKLSPNRGGTIVLKSKSYQIEMTVLPVTGRVKIYPMVKQ